MIDVAFIGGFGRSGSTLLERVIAELPDVCVLGEVLHMWQRGVRDNELCGCGEPFHSCPFWSSVGAEAFGGWHNVDVDAVLRLHDRVDRTRYIPGDIVSSSRSARHAQAREYADFFARVYAAAATVSGARIVVDSSKNASTAFALRAHEDIGLRVLHVVRDSRGVAYSWTKRVPRPEAVGGDDPWMTRYPPGVSALLWDAHNLAFAALTRTGVPVHRVLYEQFLADPRASLAAIAEFVGAPGVPDDGFLVGDTVRLSATHQVAGNPMRFRTGELTLRPDDAWRTEFPRAQVRLVSALTAPVMMRYGYSLSAPDGGDRSAPDVPDAVAEPMPEVSNSGTLYLDPAAPLPSVEVIIATRGNRPEMLAQAIDSVRTQEYGGDMTIAVVFDGVPADEGLSAESAIPLRTLGNHRTPGLAGSRNSGIETSAAELVAFLDDDDFWLPGKLRRQVARLTASDADFATTAMRVSFHGTESARLAGGAEVTHDQLVASRMAMLHSSSFLLRRAALVEMGMVDESAPFSQNEDWDLLLRFSRQRPIAHLDEPLVSIRWGSTSMFARAWESKIDAARWIVAQHPEITQSSVGYARLLGQIAFAQAASGHRRDAAGTAARAVRLRWREPRSYLALAVASRVVSAPRVLKVLHQRGHGV